MYNNVMIKVKNATEAWDTWYNMLSNDNSDIHSRDGDVVGEVINAITVIENPTDNIVKSAIRNMPMKYAIGELLWYLSGNNNLKEIQKYTKAWDRMSDDGETVNSNYGHKIKSFYGFDQWEYVYNTLKKDSTSRQAIIHIKDAKNLYEHPSKDVPCTLTLQFMIRNNKLYLTVNMRSNDIWLGYPYDIFQFMCFQILLSMQLGVELGTYTHIAGSLHLYKRDKKEEK